MLFFNVGIVLRPFLSDGFGEIFFNRGNDLQTLDSVAENLVIVDHDATRASRWF